MSDMIHARSVQFALSDGDFEFRSAEDGDGLTIAGWITRFNEPTVISDWLGEYVEEIDPRAFDRTLSERGPAKVKMQFDHGNSVFGTLPIGVWNTIRPERRGLWGEGRIHDNWHTIPIRAAIESQALDGMSFKFKVIGEQWRKATAEGKLDHRTLTEIALFEAGPVVHQAYEGTSVALRSQAMAMYRSAYRLDLRDQQRAHSDEDVRSTLVDNTAVAPVGDAESDRAEHDPPVGITRREMRLAALSRIGVIHESTGGAA